MDVAFGAGAVAVHAVAFENFYTASLTVLHSSHPRAGEADDEWQTVTPELRLMADPHREEDAQAYHELLRHHFRPDFDTQHVVRLRLILHQPSPLWREHTVRHLRFFSARPPSIPRRLACEPPPPGSERSKRAEAFASELLALAQLTEQIRSTLRGFPRRGDGEVGLAQYMVGEWDDELLLDRRGSNG